MLKQSAVYILIFATCIAGYIISRYIQSSKRFSTEIQYKTDSATEVYMAWGLLNDSLPPHEYWPENSSQHDKMIWSRMSRIKHKFLTNVQLKAGDELYYWMVHKKDRYGNPTEVWDSGSEDSQYFLKTITASGFNPGYFILMAGALPLLLLFFKNRNKPFQFHNIEKCSVKNYIPQFDTLRAIAVLLVIFQHWLPESSFINFLPNGPIGVDIFFVLSGFLITNILLKSKKQSENSTVKRSAIFRNFYIRRTLRIFPIYYLLLLVYLILGNPALVKDGIYYFTYTSNFLFYTKQFFPANFSHLWSLAVEEQFYIIWPWIIILINKKYLPYIITFFIVMGVSVNYIFIEKSWWVRILTPACFDAFAIGGLLAYITIYRHDIVNYLQGIYKWLFAFIITLFVLSLFEFKILPPRTIHSLVAASVIYYCLFKNNNPVANFILNNKLFMWLGRVSYGAYLYHLMIPGTWKQIREKFSEWNIDLFYNKVTPAYWKPVWLFLQQFGFLILICYLSWILIEKPVNNLKKYFENKPGEQIPDIKEPIIRKI